jgi:hypothetical protein
VIAADHSPSAAEGGGQVKGVPRIEIDDAKQIRVVSKS